MRKRVIKSIFQALYPYGVFCADKRAVYLTFDDGPIPEVTPRVLAILAKYKVKATFFMVGENIDKHPEVYEQVVQAGHSIGNHSYNHLKGWRTSFKTYMENVNKWPKKTTLFRPPYGKATLRQRIALHKMGYTLIYWDILTRDYDASVTPEQMLRLIQRDTRPGSIINFHDSLKSNERMLTVLPQAIEWLQKEGYVLAAL
ncbi:MAG: polysaccharide deacetylase family protein [Paludibacteraceae bacterium]|jgi:peptidoglycan/xylan/chitin deacetylase (PgdA/CDA1 family)|nr:polysaccharide deacetylase family protein [Paludibacteraceae bacterium]MBR4499937.1 polysaccharide deacetylase family protein [Paludibacteraceae bacterium]